MPTSSRNTVYYNGARVLAILLDGRSHTYKSFVHLGLHPKTINRILRVLERIELLKVKRIIHDGLPTRWICDFVKQKHELPKVKECYGCDLVSLNPKEDFHKHRRSIDGLQDYCKNCKNQKSKDYAKKNKVAVNRVRRRRYKLFGPNLRVERS